MDEKTILKHVLNNAVKFNGKANSGAIIGKLIQEAPEIKDKINEISKKINEIVSKVNSMSLEQQEKELKKFNLPEKKKVKEVVTIPSLQNVKGKVVMRFAPNPNGPMSFGHSRIALWNYFFVNKYKGSFILRFDDTDPKTKVPMKEAYKWFQEDLKWLKIKVNKVIIQSKRLKIYYKYAEKLIQEDKAYVCTCNSEEFKKLIDKSIECECRNISPSETLKRWKKMFKGYKEGEAVYRLKTNIMHENPAVRDWPGFRIINKSNHPLDKKSKVWPLLNFASAIDDHELKITHILRGIDLEISDIRQKYIYDYFKWQYPETVYLGKLLFSGVKSTSEAKKLIQEKKLTGWNDPRLGTLKALKKRGFQAETIINFIKDARINKSDINVNFEKLSHLNKEVIDKKANRYFAIINPIKLKVENAPELTAKLPLHPSLKKGFRVLKTKDEFYIQDKLEKNKVYRLMHLFNFKNNEFISANPDQSLNASLIHWLPALKDLIKIEIVMDDAKTIKAIAEPSLKKVKKDDVIQLERNFFARCESNTIKKRVFYFAHR